MRLVSVPRRELSHAEPSVHFNPGTYQGIRLFRSGMPIQVHGHIVLIQRETR